MTEPALGKAVLELSTDDTKLNAGLDKAKASAKGLGADFKAAGIDAKGFSSQLSELHGSLQTIAGAVGLAFGAQAVVDFGKDLLAMGDQIVKVADRTGLTTDQVQRLDYVAGQSGNTLEELTGAIGQMQNRLASGDQSAVGALKALNLSFDDLAKLDPYEQMLAIADAVGQVPNPARQAQLAMDLFGKSGVAILPTLKSGMRDVAAAAPVMGEATVRSLDQMGDTLADLSTRLKVWAAGGLELFSHFGDGLVLTLYPAIAKVTDGLATLLASLLKVPGAEKVFSGLRGTVDDLRQSAQWYRDAAKAQEHQLDATAVAAQKAHGPTVALTMATKEHGAQQRATTKALADSVPVTAEAQHVLDLLALAHQHQVAELKLEESAWRAWENTVSKALQNIEKSSAPLKLIGRDLSGIVPQIDAGGAGNMAGWVGPSGPGFLGKLFGSPAELGQQLSSVILGAIQGGGNPASAAAGVVGSKIGSSIAGSLKKDGTPKFTGALGSIFSGALPVIGSLIGPLTDALWGHFFGTKGRDLVKDFAATFETFNLDTLKMSGDGFEKLHAQLLALPDPAYGEKLWRALTQGVGRNNPEQAKAVIDAITAALQAQKTKTEDVADAALESSTKQQEALDAITAKYADTIAAIDSEYKSLSDAVAQEAEEDVMGLVETQQRARMQQLDDEKKAIEAQRDAEIAAKQETFDGVLDSAQHIDLAIRELFGKPLEIPYIFTPLNSPGGLPPAFLPGQESSLSASSRAVAQIRSSSIVIENRVNLDGREIARNQVRHLPNALAVVGVGRR